MPAGETIRCWLPYPRRDVARQSDVQLLSTSEQNYTIAPDECRHSTLYMERKAVAGEPAIFSETFEYTSAGERHDLQSIESLPYDTTSAVYREYTSERERHIRFTPRLRALAARVVGDAATPAQKAERIFRYICEHYPWASAREYSTIDNIPEYVVDNGHGDCGQVSLLFITLCRISGIPARFQSGFMMHPGAWNLHDWAEIYIEGTGWVPVDQSLSPQRNGRFPARRGRVARRKPLLHAVELRHADRVSRQLTFIKQQLNPHRRRPIRQKFVSSCTVRQSCGETSAEGIVSSRDNCYYIHT